MPKSAPTTIFYATDLHGSDICFKKFLRAANFYGADMLFLGGDYSPKETFLISSSETHVLRNAGVLTVEHFANTRHKEQFVTWLRERGKPIVNVGNTLFSDLTTREINELCEREIRNQLDKWVNWAAELSAAASIPIIVIPGNDDSPSTDSLFAAPPFYFLNSLQIELENHISVLGWGGSNPTPWHTIREFSENEISGQLIDAWTQPPEGTASILFAHPPPYRSGLDLAPEIGEHLQYKTTLGTPALASIGSHAVRDFVDRHQPTIGLFGHVHEARGHQRLGKTLCVNPGSAYDTGRLLGCLITLSSGEILNFQLTDG